MQRCGLSPSEAKRTLGVCYIGQRRRGLFCSCKCLYLSKGGVVKDMSRRERIGHAGAVPCTWE
jgi:hypothetical protein